MSTDPRRFALLALLALVPVAGFALSREVVVGLAAVCVVVIAWSLFTMFGPSEPAAPS
jgi:uncharacterized membrane protein YukC